MAAPDPLWPPSKEHLAYHEAGHAVLLHGYGVGVTYVIISPDDLQPGRSFPERETMSKLYGDSIIAAGSTTLPRPEELEFADYIATLVGGECAVHQWSGTADDIGEVVKRWRPDIHESSIETDPRHREVYQACLVAMQYFGDVKAARNYPIEHARRAHITLSQKHKAVEAVANALLEDYTVHRARERSRAPVEGVVMAPRVNQIIEAALKGGC